MPKHLEENWYSILGGGLDEETPKVAGLHKWMELAGVGQRQSTLRAHVPCPGSSIGRYVRNMYVPYLGTINQNDPSWAPLLLQTDKW